MINKPETSEFMSLLKDKKKTPEEVASALGVTSRAVYFWISGKREPRFTIQQIQALCNLLECSVHDLPTDFSRKEESN